MTASTSSIWVTLVILQYTFISKGASRRLGKLNLAIARARRRATDFLSDGSETRARRDEGGVGFLYKTGEEGELPSKLALKSGCQSQGTANRQAFLAILLSHARPVGSVCRETLLSLSDKQVRY